MRYLKLFEEYELPKNKWEIISSNPVKKIEGKTLIELVDNAYSSTPLGSFVKTISDVVKSEWLVIDYNEEVGVDACIFYREARPDENWVGKKLQGIGHDGVKESKKLIIQKMVDVLQQDGIWIEASDAMESVLERSLDRVTDPEILNKLFPNSNVKLLETGQYERTIEGGDIVKESVFGKPKLK